MRNTMTLCLASATLLGLAACTTPPATTATTPATDDATQCVAEAGAWAVGQPVGDELVSKLQADTHSRSVRVLRPGQAATMDYRADRVNVVLDANDKVERVSCG